VLNAVKLIKTGEVFELAHVLNAQMPLSPAAFSTCRSKRTAQALEPTSVPATRRSSPPRWARSAPSSTALRTRATTTVHYNCFKTADIETRNGFTKLGIHNVGMLMTRGVLIDIAGYKGVETLTSPTRSAWADLEGAMKKQNISLQPGDAVIINTGWGKLWGKDNERHRSGNPGLGVKAAEWLIAKDPMLLGADTAPVEVSPNPRQAPFAAGAPDRAGGERRASSGEPQARGGLPARTVSEFAAHHAAAQAARAQPGSTVAARSPVPLR